jgi:hypothetical protein
MITFKAIKIKANVVKAISKSCFGNTNASVVVLKKITGKITNKIPTIVRLIFSKRLVTEFFFSGILLINR